MEAAQGIATPSSTSPSTAELRARIEHTRAEMTETIDAIQDRLSPGRLMSDVTDKVKDATIGSVKTMSDRTASGAAGASRRTIGTIKAHPVATAVAGAAVTTVVFGALWRSRHRSGSQHRMHEDGTGLSATTYEGSAPRWTDAGDMDGERSSAAGFGANTRTLFLGACTALACWGAWRSRHHGNGRPLAVRIPIEPAERHASSMDRPAT